MSALIPAVSLVLFAVSGANAQTSLYWNSPNTQAWSGNFWAPNADGTGTLTTPANDLTTNIAVFNASTQTGTRTINLTAATSIYGIVQSQTGATQIRTNGTNRNLNIGAGGITKDIGSGAFNWGTTGAGNQVNVVLGANQTWTNNSSSAILNNNPSNGISLSTFTLTIDGTSAGAVDLSVGTTTGSGGFIKNGANNLTLGAGSFTGGVTLNSGTLTMASNTALGGAASALTITGGTVVIGATTRNTTNNNAQNWDGNFIVSGNGQTWNTGTGAVTLSGNRTVTMGTAVGNTATMNVQGVIGDGGSGFGITKEGDGFLVLSAANTYTGATTVSAGTLAIGAGGSIANSSGVVLNGGNFNVTAVPGFTIGGSQSLTGNGSVTGDITVGGNLAIGAASPGTMTFNNNLAVVGGSSSDFGFTLSDFTLGSFDLAVGGVGAQEASFGGILNLMFDSGETYANGSTVQIFDFETYAGNFGTVNVTGLGAGQDATFNSSTGFVTITAIPEPKAALLGALGMLALLRRRRIS